METNELLFWVPIFVISIITLVKASEWFSNAAERVGLALRIPSFIIGVTIVAIGTSLPEIISSISAVQQGSSEIVFGNVLGSNITNIFLVLGVGAILAKKLEITYELLHVDLPLFVGSTFFVALSILDGNFNAYEGLLGLFGLLIYILYTINTRKNKKNQEIKDALKKEHKKPHTVNSLTFITFLVSAILIFISARYTVMSAVEISETLNIATEIIATGAVALGTSLPELFVVISAARQGKSEMVVGSVLGSSIVNSFGVIGIASLFGTIVVPSTIINFALPIVIAATLLYFFITQEKQITKWEGWLLILFYLLFIGGLISLAS